MAKTGTKSVSATISQAHFDAIEDYRWSQRKNLSQIIDQAVAEFIVNHDVPVPSAAVPAEQDTLPEPEKPATGKGK